MATIPRTIDSAATGAYILSGYTTASNAQTVLSDAISDSSDEFDLPREMRMTPRDFKLFLVALESDEEPNEKLKALFRE